MKRILAMGVCCVMCLLIASCGAEKTEMPTDPNPDPTPVSTIDNGLIQGININFKSGHGATSLTLDPNYYRDDMIRKDLARIKQLGFNSIRILSKVDGGTAIQFAANLDMYMKPYEDFMLACRENGLRVLPVLLPSSPGAGTYGDENSTYYKILKAFVEKIDKVYSDILIGFEICNEPDTNTFGLNDEDALARIQADTIWNEERKPYIAWVAKTLRELGAKAPLSVGNMNSLRYESFDAEHMDVANFHNYETPFYDFVRYIEQIREIDMEVLGKERPLIITEIGHQGGRIQSPSEAIAYCRENNIGYFVWEYYNSFYWGDIQGLMDMRNRLRVSGLPFDMVRNYGVHAPLRTAGYDLTYGGTKALASALVQISGGVKNGSLDALSESAEFAYNCARATAPYYMPDFREAVFFAEGGTTEEKFKTIILECIDIMRPYIREYGSYTNDNLLGGEAKVSYAENAAVKYSSVENNSNRARYAFRAGKDGTDGIWMQSENLLVAKTAIDPSKTHVLSADLKPDLDRWAGLAIVCGDNSGESDTGNQGVYLRVTGKISDGAKALPLSGNTKEYSVTVVVRDRYGALKQTALLDLKAEDFDQDGYINIRVEYKGDATEGNALSASVYCGERNVGSFTVVDGLEKGEKYVGLESPGAYVTFFDNLKLENVTDKTVVFSDSFEQGKVDNDLLTYKPGQNHAILDKFAEIEAVLNRQLSVALGTPKEVEVFVAGNLLTILWQDKSKGHSGYEIQRSPDGVNWETYWRTTPSQSSAIIPLYGGYASRYTYRVGPVASMNTVTRFSDPVKSKEAQTNSNGYPAFKTASGKSFEVAAQGTTVVLLEK